MTNEESKEFVDKLFEVTLENAIRNVKTSKLFCITRNGNYDSYIANDYIKKMSEYAIYCKEDEQENWTECIKQLVYMAGDVDDYELLEELHAFENTGEIMSLISKKESWKNIKKIIKNQGHTGISISLIGQKMLHFSPSGIQFAEKVIGAKSITLLENLNKVYKDEKGKQKVKN